MATPEPPGTELALTGPATSLAAGPVTLATLNEATRGLRENLVGMVELGAQAWREQRGDVLTAAITVDGEHIPPRLPAEHAAPLVRELFTVADVFTRISKDFAAAADAARLEAGIEAEAVGDTDRAGQTLLVVTDTGGGAKLKVRPKTRDVTNVDEEKLSAVLAALAVARTTDWEPPACTGHPDDPDGHYWCELTGDGVCAHCGQQTYWRIYDEGRADGASIAREEVTRLGRVEWRVTDLRALAKAMAAAGMPDVAALADEAVARVKVPTGGWTVDRDTGARRA